MQVFRSRMFFGLAAILLNTALGTATAQDFVDPLREFAHQAVRQCWPPYRYRIVGLSGLSIRNRIQPD